MAGKLVWRGSVKDSWKSHINAGLPVFEEGTGDMLFCTNDCARCCDCEKKSHLISWYFFFFHEENKHLISWFFSVISHFSWFPGPPLLSPLRPSSSLISLSLSFSRSLSSRSTLSANSCLSAAQKWLCLADSSDKRLNACCPQRRGERENGWGGENREMASRERWGNWERIRITIIILVLFVRSQLGWQFWT